MSSRRRPTPRPQPRFGDSRDVGPRVDEAVAAFDRQTRELRRRKEREQREQAEQVPRCWRSSGWQLIDTSGAVRGELEPELAAEVARALNRYHGMEEQKA